LNLTPGALRVIATSALGKFALDIFIREIIWLGGVVLVELRSALRPEHVINLNEFMWGALARHVWGSAINYCVGAAAIIKVCRLGVHENMLVRAVLWDRPILHPLQARL